jgi:hypothetical protein
LAKVVPWHWLAKVGRLASSCAANGAGKALAKEIGDARGFTVTTRATQIATPVLHRHPLTDCPERDIIVNGAGQHHPVISARFRATTEYTRLKPTC